MVRPLHTHPINGFAGNCTRSDAEVSEDNVRSTGESQRMALDYNALTWSSLPGKGDVLAIDSHAAFRRDNTTDVEDDNTRALGDC